MKFIQAHQMAKNDEREADERVAGVALDEAVVQARRGLRDGHHEGQVEEQLERRRRPVLLGGGPGLEGSSQRGHRHAGRMPERGRAGW